ncbi:VanW family protein [Peptostreptococcus faecalis]|uniref:VanW family protein n=1 Tax=Peptostreptococcus faecalis TaxID=2045015 RepID=UPI000C7ABF6A|nr:VanW family protein [Peptostreptococcus faecalis]
MELLKGNKKIFISVGILVGVLVVGTAYLGYQVNSDKIAKNVIVAGVDVGKMTKSEALNKLKSNEKLKNMILSYKGKKWDVSRDDINLDIDFNKTAEDALKFNKSKGFFSNMIITLKADFGSKSTVPLSMTYDKVKLKSKLENIKKDFDSPVKDATLEFKNEKTVIIADEAGKSLNIKSSLDNIDKNLKKDKFNINLVVDLKEAKLKKDDLKGIDTMLASFSTGFGGMPGRDYNIVKSALDTSGVILKPGEEFSFNALTGDKSIANGYKYAPVIESGKLVMGVGGGVCQTSSTIFNTALLSGMEITTRRNHSIPSDYVKLGRDATITDGKSGQDFKFKNPYKNAVYIKNYSTGNKIVSQIYGSKEDKQNIDITTQMTSSYGGGSKVIKDASLPAGKKVIEKYSRPGYGVITYRIYKDGSGKTTKTEKVATSSYPSQVGIVRVGAAPAKPVAKPVAKPATTGVKKPATQAPATNVQTGTSTVAKQ